jgi:hypothetical protein
VTDLDEPLPADLGWCQLERIKPGQYGIAFTPKLSLDLMIVYDRTLFIDADCLIFAPLDRLFALFSGRSVATVGTQVSDGEWCGDVAERCRRLHVNSVPRFNGGLYYIERGDASNSVYRRARELVQSYDDLGLVRLRGHPNEEPLMSSAMALHGLQAVPDDGSFMSDPMACPGPMYLNVLAGYRRLVNPPSRSPGHQSWYPFGTVSPTIVHFLGHHIQEYPYRSEAARLALVARSYPTWLANLIVSLIVRWPGAAQTSIKSWLRPAFHRLFGPRRVLRTQKEFVIPD